MKRSLSFAPPWIWRRNNGRPTRRWGVRSVCSIRRTKPSSNIRKRRDLRHSRPSYTTNLARCLLSSHNSKKQKTNFEKR